MEKFSLLTENLELRKRIAELEGLVEELKKPAPAKPAEDSHDNDGASPNTNGFDYSLVDPKLDLDEFKRYGRQMILPEIGLQGQLQLKRTKALIIGAGGLGCPASAYLAGAGVGTIGIIDHDTVELSNLHRQILHSTGSIGLSKTDSAINRLREINPTVQYIAHRESLTPLNALDVIDKYDVIFDCTDLPSTRYIISDACVLLSKSLISAAALRADGQLLVLNNPPNEGPCYRCVFPRPPPPDMVLTCGEGGVLGPVVGVMGVLMAVEGIKLIVSRAPTVHRRRPGYASFSPVATRKDTTTTEDEAARKDAALAKDEPPPKKDFTMTIYSGFNDTPFRTVRLLGKRKTCPACSPTARTITKEALREGLLDYVAFCGGKPSSKFTPLSPEDRIDVEEYSKMREEGKPGWLVDVRDKTQYNICALEGGINVPISTILTLPSGTASSEDGEILSTPTWLPEDPEQPVYFICRLGNDSQIAVQRLKQSGLAEGRIVKDIKGGLWEWARLVDQEFPVY